MSENQEEQKYSNVQIIDMLSSYTKLNYWKDIFVKSSQHTVRYAAFKTKESLDKLKTLLPKSVFEELKLSDLEVQLNEELVKN